MLPVLEDSTQVALLTWLLLFLLRMQAKHYIPDVALNSLLKFLYMFLVILGRYSEFVQCIVPIFPKTLYHLQNFFKLKEEFTRFVVCRKCYSVYKIDDCVERHGTSVTSKFCSHRTHPNSPSDCHTLLLKTVRLLGDKSSSILSKYTATQVFNNHFKNFSIIHILLICVTIGALEQTVMTHFKIFMMDNYGRTFNI